MFFLQKAIINKDLVLLLSNSPVYLVSFIAKKFKIDYFEGSRYKKDKNGKFCSVVSVMDGEEKAKYTLNFRKKHADVEKLIAYSDSIWDKPLLELADKCYIIDPDRKLRALAKIKKWNIL